MLNKLRHLPRLGMSDAQKIYGLTARALRFYEERGLLHAQRDRLNCRYFDGEARRRLGWISVLRSAGVSLPDVQDVLQADDADERGRQAALAKLERRRRALAEQLATVEALSTALAAEGDDADVNPHALLSAA